jgi:hypothetical protein
MGVRFYDTLSLSLAFSFMYYKKYCKEGELTVYLSRSGHSVLGIYLKIANDFFGTERYQHLLALPDLDTF